MTSTFGGKYLVGRECAGGVDIYNQSCVSQNFLSSGFFTQLPLPLMPPLLLLLLLRMPPLPAD